MTSLVVSHSNRPPFCSEPEISGGSVVGRVYLTTIGDRLALVRVKGAPNSGHDLMSFIRIVEAVSIQRLNVPDLLVLDQQNQLAQPHSPGSTNNQQQSAFKLGTHGSDQVHDHHNKSAPTFSGNYINHYGENQRHQAQNLPETASLSINPPEEINFECLISFDKRKDKNLIVKWYHEDRPEPIYQWIPELSKRSIASHYRAHIVPVVPNLVGSTDHFNQQSQRLMDLQAMNNNDNNNQTQLIEAGFKLVKPTKELGGKYTCSAISVQNDDSKWKKMIVFTPPRSFHLNVSRTDIGAQLANQRERLIQQSQPALGLGWLAPSSQMMLSTASQQKSLPIQASPMTTISPLMYSTIDYVNVNQQRARNQLSNSNNGMAAWHATMPTNSQLMLGSTTTGNNHNLPPPYDTNMRLTSWARRSQAQQQPQTQQLQMVPAPIFSAIGNLQVGTQNTSKQTPRQANNQNGLKLVCDIDQVFPIPEVKIYSLARADGSHPDKLSILDTRIERYSQNGLFHVQVISVLDVEDLLRKYGPDMPIYFECLIALTNLELSKYADNKRSAIYWPGQIANSLTREVQDGDLSVEQHANNYSNSRLKPTNIIMIWPSTITLFYKVIFSLYQRFRCY